jgi:cardiolipin synthase (CMP-forming)
MGNGRLARMNLANKITISRILLIPFFIALILYLKWEIALFVFILAALSDALDGYIARATKQRTELGEILDPIADKLLILSAFICLSVVKNPALPVQIPLYVPIVIISRDALIVLGALLIYLIKGDIDIKPTLASKITTCLQMITVISVLIKSEFSPVLWNATVVFTLLSGAEYIIRGNRLLNDKAQGTANGARK